MRLHIHNCNILLQWFKIVIYYLTAVAPKGNVLLLHPSNLVKANARNCQILIDKDPHVEQNNLDTLTEQELVPKANEAKEQLGVTLDIEDYTFMGVKKLANGGVVFDMNTPNTVKWVHLHKHTFTEKFRGTAIIKERTVSVIIEYVPTSYTPKVLAEHRKIKRDSKLPSNTLAATKWIKPIHRHTKSQKSAHIIAKFTSTKAANQSIRESLIIAGKRTWARRLKREPRRCLKCQKINSHHMAANCPLADTCSTCAKGHRTAECNETDPTKKRMNLSSIRKKIFLVGRLQDLKL